MNDSTRVRRRQAPRDSEHALEVVLEHCRTPETEQQAYDALAFKNDMLWAVMDGIDRAYPA